MKTKRKKEKKGSKGWKKRKVEKGKGKKRKGKKEREKKKGKKRKGKKEREKKKGKKRKGKENRKKGKENREKEKVKREGEDKKNKDLEFAPTPTIKQSISSSTAFKPSAGGCVFNAQYIQTITSRKTDSHRLIFPRQYLPDPFCIPPQFLAAKHKIPLLRARITKEQKSMFQYQRIATDVRHRIRRLIAGNGNTLSFDRLKHFICCALRMQSVFLPLLYQDMLILAVERRQNHDLDVVIRCPEPPPHIPVKLFPRLGVLGQGDQCRPPATSHTFWPGTAC
jgi:hypothetical protein